MEKRALGQSGIQASKVGFGAWAISGWLWGGTEQNDSVHAIHAALDNGINLIDTAPAYGFGLSEEILGDALKDRRDQAVIATKCGLIWNRQDVGVYHYESEGHVIHQHLGPASIREELENSLRRLQTDYIDLYQTHWQDPTVPVEETMAELMKMKDEGKIRAIGCSNASMDHIRAYIAAGQLDVDQEHYSMLNRKQEAEKLPFCRERHMAVLAYSPMDRGLLTGKITPDRQFPDNDARSEIPLFSVENRRKVIAMLDEFQPIADGHNCTMAQLVVAWTVAQPGLTHALTGARNAKQAMENAAAGEVELSREDVQTMTDILDRHFPKEA